MVIGIIFDMVQC